MNESLIIQRLERIERDQKRILDLLTGAKKEKAWVKSPQIMKLTGWNREKMRQMRVNGIIKFKHDATGFWYDLNSIPAVLIQHNENNSTNRDGTVDRAGAVIG